MIRVGIDLVPFGTEDPVRLGSVKIVNDLSGTKTQGNYRYNIFDKSGKSLKFGYITGFPRTKLLAHDLLYRVLKDALEYRN